MLLLDLPPELLQLILLCSSTPSFVQLILTCHTLFDLAARSRGVIRHHIEGLPGRRAVSLLSTASTKKLFLILRRRAGASLQGVNITADRQDFYFPHSTIDVRASCITSADHHNIALVRKGVPSVQIYQASKGELKLRRILNPWSNDRRKYEPQQTVFDQMNNVFIMYGMDGTDEMPAHPHHPRGEPSTRHSGTEARLMHVRLSDLSWSQDFWDVDGVGHMNLGEGEEAVRPISMAAHAGKKVSVAWDSGISVDGVKYTFIAVYTLLEEGEVHSMYTGNEPCSMDYRSYANTRIAFSSGGEALRCYSPGMATPTFRMAQLTDNPVSDANVNQMWVELEDGSTEYFFVEDAFFHYHETIKAKDHRSDSFCRHVGLCFATVTFASVRQTIACILKRRRKTPENECSHIVDPDEPPDLYSYTSVLARLCFFEPPVTSMPTVMAFAETGTRIAIAYWDKIFVWPFQPEILAGKYDDCQPYPKTYDKNLKCSIVELKPIVLRAEAVVHKMAFTGSENELVAITDKGLQIWNLGPSATGLRSVNTLPEEEDDDGESSYLKSPQAPKITRRPIKASTEASTNYQLRIGWK